VLSLLAGSEAQTVLAAQKETRGGDERAASVPDMRNPRGAPKKVLHGPSVFEVREGSGEGEGIVLEMLHQAIPGIGQTKEISMKEEFGSIGTT